MGVGCVMVNRSISKQTLLRLPLYLNYMKQLGENTPEHISATTIAEALRLNHVVVRKDLMHYSVGKRIIQPEFLESERKFRDKWKFS